MSDTPASLRICLVGADSSVGGHIIANAAHIKLSGIVQVEIVGGILDPESRSKTHSGSEKSGLLLSNQWEKDFDRANVIVEVSSQNGCRLAAELALERKVPLLSAARGLNVQAQYQLIEASKSIPVLRTTNLSAGMSFLYWACKRAAVMLGSDFEAEVVETCSRARRESPGGTAISLAESIARSRGLNAVQVMRNVKDVREVSRSAGDVGISSLRGGNVLGDHSILFLGSDERVDLNHRVLSEGAYANGALRAAAWLLTRNPGFYSMQDLIEDTWLKNQP